jgi:hypothetical protein
LIFVFLDDENQDSDTQIEENVVGEAVVDVAQKWLNVTEMEEFEATMQIACLCSTDDAHHVSKKLSDI